MSDATGMPPGGDPFGGAGQPSEEQVQAMLAQMRAMPVDQHLAQALQLLLEGAQVKIGRNDGRLLLDSAMVLAAHVRPYADAELVAQVDEAVAQLRMAQVQAESQLQRAAMEEGHAEANDLPTPPRPPQLPTSQDAPEDAAPGGEAGDGEAGEGAAPQADQPAPPTQAPRQQPPSGSGGSRLWVPGR